MLKYIVTEMNFLIREDNDTNLLKNSLYIRSQIYWCDVPHFDDKMIILNFDLTIIENGDKTVPRL